MSVMTDVRTDYHLLFAFGDRHIPHHNPAIDKLLLSIIGDLQPDIILDGGDMISADCLSRFPKTCEQKVGLQDELDKDQEWRCLIDKASPHSQKVILLDNHFCRRLDDFCKKDDNHWVAGMRAMSVESMLNTQQYHWEVVNEWIWNDRLMFIHGDGQGVSGTSKCPANKVRQNVRQAMMSIVQFHSHATGFEFIRSGHHHHIAVQLGTVMDLEKVDYVKHNSLGNTTNSVGLFYLPKPHVVEQTPSFEPGLIMNDRTLLHGRIYTAD